MHKLRNAVIMSVRCASHALGATARGGNLRVEQSMHTQMYAEQTMKVSPTLIMVNQLLALSSMELQHMVRAEIENVTRSRGRF